MRTFLGLFLTILVGMGTAFASSDTTKTDYKYFNKQKAHILEASRINGISPELITAIGSKESGLGRNTKNPHSRVAGVMQMRGSTYKAGLKKHHAKLGLSANASINNDRANILVATAALADNKRYLERVTGRRITDGDVYMSHFLGLGGAEAILNGKPNAKISRYVKLRKGNWSMYTEKGRVLTVAQFRSKMDRIVKQESARYAVLIRQNQLDRLITQVAYNN